MDAREHIARRVIILDRGNPCFERLTTACHAAELALHALFLTREARSGGIGNPHPDTVEGPWRRARILRPSTPPHAAATAIRRLSAATSRPSAVETT